MDPLPDETTVRRYVGAMLGAAVGEALAAPVRHKNGRAIQAAYGQHGITAYDDQPYGFGAIAEHSKLALAVVEGLLKSPTPLMPHPTQLWMHQVIGREKACLTSAQNPCTGAAVIARSHPIGLAYAGDRHALTAMAQGQARSCPVRPVDEAAAVLWAHALAYTSEGVAPEGLPELLADVHPPRGLEIAEAWDGLLEQLATARAAAIPGAYARVVMNDLGDASDPVSALVLALAGYWCCPDDFDQAIVHAANIDGDSPAVASMVGALVGLRSPPGGSWTEPLEWRRRLTTAGFGLALLNLTTRASLG